MNFDFIKSTKIFIHITSVCRIIYELIICMQKSSEYSEYLEHNPEKVWDLFLYTLKEIYIICIIWFLLFAAIKIIELIILKLKQNGSLQNQYSDINKTSGMTEYKSEHEWRCPNCGNMISSSFCSYCGIASETGIQKLESISVCANCGYNTTYQNNCPNCGSSLKTTKHFNNSDICTICGKENTAVQPVMLYKKGEKAYFECACNECIAECVQNPNSIPTKINNKIEQLTLNNQLLHNISDEENQWMCMACGRTLPFTQDRCSCGYKKQI